MNLDQLADDGVVLSSTLSAAGHSPHAISRLARDGALVALSRGAWTTPGWLEQFSLPHDRPRALHRARTVAFLRQMPQRVAAAAVSAAVLHDLSLWRAPLDRVHLIRTGDQQSRLRSEATIHQTGRARFAEESIWPTVAVADAVVQLGMQVASTQPEEFLMAGDHALRRRLATTGDLEDAVARHTKCHGMAAVRGLLPVLDARHESASESRLGLTMTLIGRASTPQVRLLVNGKVYRPDRLLDDHPVVIEADGLDKYGLTSGDVRESLAKEKLREDELREAGFGFVRARWHDMDDPWGFDRRIERSIQSLHGRRLSSQVRFLDDHPLARR